MWSLVLFHQLLIDSNHFFLNISKQFEFGWVFQYKNYKGRRMLLTISLIIFRCACKSKWKNTLTFTYIIEVFLWIDESNSFSSIRASNLIWIRLRWFTMNFILSSRLEITEHCVLSVGGIVEYWRCDSLLPIYEHFKLLCGVATASVPILFTYLYVKTLLYFAWNFSQIQNSIWLHDNCSRNESNDFTVLDELYVESNHYINHVLYNNIHHQCL